ncbi:MAG: hypothetical protein DRO40_00180 [Thermoprotei archaeon]|nr:MAG: hypothetical protein DRO40_00180 [Thermoprotei archaeon]
MISIVNRAQSEAKTLYIATREKIAKNLASCGYRIIWWPVAILTLEDCGRNNLYLTDCYVCGVTDSAKARLLLTIRLDKDVETLSNSRYKP